MSVRLFVGNLPFGVTETELRELFSPVGEVSQVRLPTDRETGKPRGFAFVDFEERAQAQEAIRRFNQFMFKDRAIAVNEAVARDARPKPGAGAREFTPRPNSSPREFSPRPNSAPQSFIPAPEDDPSALGQPRRTFNPEASARDKRKQKGYASKEERGPKGPLREFGGGLQYPGADFDDDDDDDDQGLDDFALWQREDAMNQDEE